MFKYFLLAFIFIPIIELALLIQVGSVIGTFETILLVIGTGVAGAYLAQTQGLLAMRRVQENLDKGVMPTEELVDGFMILVGGGVLLTPGLITDIFGLLCLLPGTRSLLKAWLRKYFTLYAVENNQVIIEGEAWEESKEKDADKRLR